MISFLFVLVFLYPSFVDCIEWTVNWAFGCTFVGNDLFNQTSPGSECGPLCEQTPNCTHFNWVNNFNYGTCYLKKDSVSMMNSTIMNSNDYLCGIVVDTNWSVPHNWSNCDFNGHDLSNQVSEDTKCAYICGNTQDCTHFTWKRDTSLGTCYLKKGFISRDDAITDNNLYKVCGINLKYVPLKWNENWALGCDFDDHDFTNTGSTDRENCSYVCTNTYGCTHYVLSDYEGGRCWMKSWNVTKEDAFFKSQKMWCGIVREGGGMTTHDWASTWMALVPNGIQMMDLLIPGTHLSCAVRVNDYVQTQWATVDQQLNRGIRYFDMRVGRCQTTNTTTTPTMTTAPTLCMYHGNVDLHMSFDEPLKQMYDFLRSNNSEVIIMRLSYENNDNNKGIIDFQSFVETNYMDNHTEWFNSSSEGDGGGGGGLGGLESLKIDKVRGRIIVLWDSGSKSSKYGYDYDWIDTRRGESYDTNEAYDIFKNRYFYSAVVGGAGTGGNGSSSSPSWYENPTHTCKGRCIPKIEADVINTSVINLLNTINDQEGRGIISMDFPSDEIIRKIIEITLLHQRNNI